MAVWEAQGGQGYGRWGETVGACLYERLRAARAIVDEGNSRGMAVWEAPDGQGYGRWRKQQLYGRYMESYIVAIITSFLIFRF